jgi:hypothetical protein
MEYQTLKEILKNSKDIAYKCHLFFPTHAQSARHLVYGEITTLETILELCKENSFKECFIILRSVLEKLFYFWLLLHGKRYRGRREFIVPHKDNKSGNERREEIFNSWRKLKKENHENFRDIKTIQKHPKIDNIIIITYETTGLFDETDKERNEPIPYYNFMLQTYNPEIAHLGKLKILENDIIPIDSQSIKNHKFYYTYYFHFQNILENLLLNNLINKEQMEKIIVHYNFFSKYTHVSKDTIDIETHRRNKFNDLHQYDKTYRKLIYLYIAKFLFLYINFILLKFSSQIRQNELLEYQSSVNTLKEFSKELWFFDDDPTPSDIVVSNQKKDLLNSHQNQDDSSLTRYYLDPFTRLHQKQNRIP